jgi:hypothetical protein
MSIAYIIDVRVKRVEDDVTVATAEEHATVRPDDVDVGTHDGLQAVLRGEGGNAVAAAFTRVWAPEGSQR